MKPNKDFKPKDGVNTILTIGLVLCSLFLLWLASHTEMPYAILIAIAFSYPLLTNFALFHEGSHNNQHSNPTLNHILATMSCWLFPVAFTFYAKVHLFHHQKNRSEHENFEYYYADDSFWMTFYRHMQWYAIMIGTYWLFIPVVSTLSTIFPRFSKLQFFQQLPTSSKLFEDIDESAIRNMRYETISGVVFWSTAWVVLDLNLPSVALCYACFAFNWSTRQYIAHAFAPRNRKHGAHNLRVTKSIERMLLNSNWHLVHHQHPDIPWHLLPEYADDSPRIDYGRQYLRLWTAPKLLQSAKNELQGKE